MASPSYTPWFGHPNDFFMQEMLAAEAWFHSSASPRGICGKHSGNGRGFSPTTAVSHVSILPPLLHTHSFNYHWSHNNHSNLQSFCITLTFKENKSRRSSLWNFEQPSRIPSLLGPHTFLNFLLSNALGLYSFLKGSENFTLAKSQRRYWKICVLYLAADTEAAFLEIS